jgi:hypothetical protein
MAPVFYQTFTAARTTEPDLASLVAQLRALDATAGIQHQPGSQAFVIKKNTAWTGANITAAQNALDTAPASTPQLTAQADIDAMPLATKAAFLLILDRFNLIGTKLTPPLPNVTPAQFLQAIRDKAATL